jgi:acetyl-CoA carboxylase carboxyltransferase component
MGVVAGGAYLPIIDEAIIVDKTIIFLAGVIWSKAAIGENADNETLGGATLPLRNFQVLLIKEPKTIKTL